MFSSNKNIVNDATVIIGGISNGNRLSWGAWKPKAEIS